MASSCRTWRQKAPMRLAPGLKNDFICYEVQPSWLTAPQVYGDFCLMGNDGPQPHFLQTYCRTGLSIKRPASIFPLSLSIPWRIIHCFAIAYSLALLSSHLQYMYHSLDASQVLCHVTYGKRQSHRISVKPCRLIYVTYQLVAL